MVDPAVQLNASALFGLMFDEDEDDDDGGQPMYKKQINIDIKPDPVINDYTNVIPIPRAINTHESLIARAFWITQARRASASAHPFRRIAVYMWPLIKKCFVHFRLVGKIREKITIDLYILIYTAFK